MSNRIVFLTYLRRSGSTYLAQMLDGFADIGVTLEAGFLDGLTAPKCEPKSFAELDSYLDLLYGESKLRSVPVSDLPKFRYWSIDRQKLRSHLCVRFPVSVKRFLETVVALYFENNVAKVWVYKNGNYLWHIPELRRMFPAAKVVFVMRDPRAVYLSQKTSRSSITGEPMCTNPFVVGERFRRAGKIVHRLRNESWFHCVRYESLLTNPDRELCKLLSFLSASQTRTTSEESYERNIPKPQRHLHINISKPPIVKRITAWEDELDLAEQAIIEMMAAKQLRRFGYQSQFKSLTCIQRAMSGRTHWVDGGRRVVRRLCKAVGSKSAAFP